MEATEREKREGWGKGGGFREVKKAGGGGRWKGDRKVEEGETGREDGDGGGSP